MRAACCDDRILESIAEPWVRRDGAVSFVKPAGRGRHLDRAHHIATAHQPDPHDLIQNACGWLLRECRKGDPGRLEEYLMELGPAMPRTTVRYAIQRFPQAQPKRIQENTRKPSLTGPASV